MTNNFRFVATTYAGLEQVLAEELIGLGADDVEEGRRSVYFKGNLALMYKANYSLRTALKILMPLRSFRIKRVDDLYHQVSKIKWEDYFDVNQTFAIQSKVFSDLFTNSMFASLKAKDAIVDRFRKIDGKRPSISVNNPEILINFHISNSNNCTISLDSSGDSLHKRGYRLGNHEAPISEVLAAGMIKLSGWSGEEPLCDPMCGSGTIVIEAAMMAKNVLPGEIRQNYSFQKWKNYDPELFKMLKSQNEHTQVGFKIFGSDISRENIDLAYKNAEKANVLDVVQLEIADFRRLEKNESSFLLFNPPYGERIKAGDQAFYSMVGERLKHHFPNTTAWLISTNECLKSIGLKPEVKIPLYNGSLSCSFREYKLYKGSKKSST
ncbi:THUMP domain-containing class I SAM-dependent RNA methyltransferase [Sunxiuqinia indica]|uniref:THUMP domain-containing class I SAM-dependent RNA methyltransferase n=1 Tax=Sunxiuqinia indica TaxID=2692584 RepID=UPI00135AB09E|nr:class I SAM-dependent RNA methyltransferase [Sunxiuqinia indica]